MRFTAQKRLASKLLKASPKRIKFDSEALEEIKEAITKADLRGLIKDNAIIKKQKKGIAKKEKKKRSGPGSRKGKRSARESPKRAWINRARSQRALIRKLRDEKKLSTSDYRMLYLKIKGGFFRSKRHLKLFIDEHKLLSKNPTQSSEK